MVHIRDLVDKFEYNINHYRSKQYNETQLRVDFLDPLFALFGWDITNKKNKPTNEREVLVEESLKQTKSSNIKKPDYTFRLFSERKFFLEAKKPSVDILNDSEPAKQIRRYGFTAKLKISVLSNFEYLIIYDTSDLVSEKDKPSDFRVRIYHYTEFEEKFVEINKLLGYESVYSGVFELEWSYIEEKLKKFSVDDLFLKQINNWRLGLAKELIHTDSNMDESKLNDLVQSYINSLFFLRVCEDRNLEIYQTLLSSSRDKDINLLIKILKKADKKYNSGLFKMECIDLILGNRKSFIWTIIDELYYPKSPYSFSVFTSDILGNIYEIFLSEKIKIDCGDVTLRPKEENIDRDIVTTPTFIISDILRKTIIKYCQGKTDKQILNSKFADIACGSGAFLLEAFQAIQDILIDFYLKNDKSKVQQTSLNSYKLHFDIKKQILVSCLFGVDKDFNAVKACQFGLLLKLLEGETNETITTPILPMLDDNIFFGNSLININWCKESSINIINPFNFNKLKFDIIVGNPPYLSTEEIKNLTPLELPLYKKHYISAFKQFDKYFLFVERAFELLSENGYLGYILPSKFMKVGAGEKLRNLLASNRYVTELISFGANQIFKDKTTYTCLLIARKQNNQDFSFVDVLSLADWKTRNNKNIESSFMPNDSLDSDVWILEKSTIKILGELHEKTLSLEALLGKKSIENGIQTSANKVYIHNVDHEDENYIYFTYKNNKFSIEKELTRPYYQTQHGLNEKFHTYRELKPNSFVIYPYRRMKDKITHVPYHDLKEHFPCLFSYLLSVKDELDNDKRDIKPEVETTNEWYRYGRHQSLENCDVDVKIIVGVLSNGYKYAIDTHRTFISSGGTAGYCLINIPSSTQYSPYYIQALLSSKYLEWFASLYGEIFRGGFIARGTKVLKRMPIIPIDFKDPKKTCIHDKIVQLQKKLIEDYSIFDAVTERDKHIIKRRFLQNKQALDIIISELYDLHDDNKIPAIETLYGTKGLFE